MKKMAVNTYEFEELNKEVQNKVLVKVASLLNDDFWEYECEDFFAGTEIEKLHDNGIMANTADISLDFNYGACWNFFGKVKFDLPLLMEKANFSSDIVEAYKDDIIYFYEDDNSFYYDGEPSEKLDGIIQKANKQFSLFVRSLLDNYANNIYDMWLAQISDENCIEYIEDNGMRFLSDGTSIDSIAR